MHKATARCCTAISGQMLFTPITVNILHWSHSPVQARPIVFMTHRTVRGAVANSCPLPERIRAGSIHRCLHLQVPASQKLHNQAEAGLSCGRRVCLTNRLHAWARTSTANARCFQQKNRMQVHSENGTAAKQCLGKVKKICIYQAVFLGGR